MASILFNNVQCMILCDTTFIGITQNNKYIYPTNKIYVPTECQKRSGTEKLENGIGFQVLPKRVFIKKTIV